MARADRLDGRDAVVGGADDLDSLLVREEVEEPLAREGLVVDDEDADGRVRHDDRQTREATAVARRSDRVWKGSRISAMVDGVAPPPGRSSKRCSSP